MKNFATLATILLLYVGYAQGCGPSGPSKQFCVTATLQGVKDTAGLTDQNSDNFKQVKQIVLLELDRVLTAKNWKGRLNPPPELVRFDVPGADVNALLDVGAAATAADLQRELNPSGVALNPPPIYQVSKIEAVEGICSGSASNGTATTTTGVNATTSP